MLEAKPALWVNKQEKTESLRYPKSASGAEYCCSWFLSSSAMHGTFAVTPPRFTTFPQSLQALSERCFRCVETAAAENFWQCKCRCGETLLRFCMRAAADEATLLEGFSPGRPAWSTVLCFPTALVSFGSGCSVDKLLCSAATLATQQLRHIWTL